MQTVLSRVKVGVRHVDKSDSTVNSSRCRQADGGSAICPIRPRYLRKSQAALYLGICQRTLTNLMQSRAVPFMRVTRGITLFDVEDLDRALLRYRVRPVGDM